MCEHVGHVGDEGVTGVNFTRNCVRQYIYSFIKFNLFIYYFFSSSMDVFGIYIPDHALSNFELYNYVRRLEIPDFRGVFMSNTLPSRPHNSECGIVNFGPSNTIGTHWVCYWKKGQDRIYFDSYGQITPHEIQIYLKTKGEGRSIKRNTDIVQSFNSNICGHLCLFVLKALSKGWTFQKVLTTLNGYSQDHWNAATPSKRLRTTES